MQGIPPGLAGDMREHLPGFLGVWPRPQDGVHRLAHPAGADGLQSAGHLGDILYAPDAEFYFACIGHSWLIWLAG
jgi:hypothetical protein